MSWTRCTLAIAMSLSGFVGRGWTQSPGAIENDLSQTMQARALLLGDEFVGQANLGVTVRNRVAILWGPVPSAGLRLRAEILLRTMIELQDVRNGLFVKEDSPGAQAEPARPAMPNFLPPTLPRGAPAPVPPRRRLPEQFPDANPSTEPQADLAHSRQFLSLS